MLTYGATGTGKTYTYHGIVDRWAKDMFKQLQQADAAVEMMVRCSVVEIYIEKIRDLLVDSSDVRFYKNKMIGCSGLSCLTADDMIQAVGQGQAVRTSSAGDATRDSTRSTFVTQIVLEQFDTRSLENKESILLLVDLPASELAAVDPSKALAKPALISATLQGLWKHVQEKADHPLETVYLLPRVGKDRPILTQMLAGSFGGNTYTTVILHLSVAQVAAAEALHTLQFGDDCRKVLNSPTQSIHHRWQDCHERVEELEDHQLRFQAVLRSLADECHRLRTNKTARATDRRLIRIIDGIRQNTTKRPIVFSVENQEEHELRMETMKHRSAQRRAERDRDIAVAKAKKLESEVAILNSQLKMLNGKATAQTKEVNSIKAENRSLTEQREELKLTLSTSRFREDEAVVFLRQFRKFYYRLLKQNEDQASGDVSTIVTSFVGAPDLTQLLDLDRMMVMSGLLEENEVGVDMSLKNYRSSQDSQKRSAGLATQTRQDVQLSLVRRRESGESVEAYQRLFKTPSGRYIELREAQLEKDLLETTKKCSALEKELSDLKEMQVSKGGTGFFEKRQAEQELRDLRKLVEKKDKDIKAVIWKMNELHMAGNLTADKVESRVPHISKLEDYVRTLESNKKVVIAERERLEQQLRDEVEILQAEVLRLSKPLWHLSDGTDLLPPLKSRLVVSFCTASEDFPKRRSSTRAVESMFDFDYAKEAKFVCDAETQTDEALLHEERRYSYITPDDYLFMDDHSVTSSDGPKDSPKRKAAPSVALEVFMRSPVPPSTPYGGMVNAYTKSNDEMFKLEMENDTQVVQASISASVSTQTKVRELDESTHSLVPAEAAAVIRDDDLVPASEVTTESLLPVSPLSPRKASASSVSRSPVSPRKAACPPFSHSSSQLQTSSVEKEPTTASLSHSSSQLHTAITRDDAQASPTQRFPSGRRQSMPLTTGATAYSSAAVPRKNQAPPPQDNASFMGKLRAQGNKKVDAHEDGDSSTPEWMKMFKRIGSRNQGEAVIETQGAAAAKELTRTTFGETLKYNDTMTTDPAAQYSSTAPKKWTPRKKDDDSDSDDSFAKNFMRGAGNAPTPSQAPRDDDSGSDNDDGSQKLHAIVKPTASPSRSGVRFSNKDDSVIGIADFIDNASYPSLEYDRSPWEDSDSTFNNSFAAKASGANKMETIEDKGKGEDSDASEEKQSAWKKPSEVKAAEAAKFGEERPSTPPWKKAAKAKADESSDSEDDSKKKIPAWKRAQMEAASKAAEEGAAKTPVATTSAVSADDSDEESAEDNIPTKGPTQAVPAGRAVDSDDESSEEGATPQPKTPIVRAPPLKHADDSEDESSDEEPAKRPAPAPARVVPPPPNPCVRDDVDSDEESVEEKPVPAPKAAPLRKYDESSSDEENVPRKPVTPSAKAPVDDEFESSSDEEPAPRKRVAAKAARPPESDESSNEENAAPCKAQEDESEYSSEEEARSPARPPLLGKGSRPPNHSSGSEEEESITERTKPSARTVRPRADSNDDEEEEATENSERQGFGAWNKPDEDSNDESGDDDDDDDDGDLRRQRSPRRTASSESQEFRDRIRSKFGGGRGHDAPKSPGDPSDPFASVRANRSGDGNLQGAFGSDPFSAGPGVASREGSSSHEDDEVDSGEDDSFVSGGKSAGFEPKRTVPDFGAKITPSSTQAANVVGGKGNNNKEKAKFVIRNGKLVKSDSVISDDSVGSGNQQLHAPHASKAKAKFVIRDGKLVKDDSAINTSLSLLEKAPLGKAERRNSLDSKKGDLEEEERLVRHQQLTTVKASKKKKSSPKSESKNSVFVIKDGKLVKSAAAAKQTVPATKPAFSIVNGKLVKNETKTKKKKGDKSKDGKKKPKKKAVRKDSF